MTGNMYILSTYYMTDTDSFCTLFHSAPPEPWGRGCCAHFTDEETSLEKLNDTRL